jgi:ferrous iron transport protein B
MRIAYPNEAILRHHHKRERAASLRNSLDDRRLRPFLAGPRVQVHDDLGVATRLGALSRSILKGEASAFTLELPPYRRPGVLRILYTSLIDRTLFVLWRACLTAAPAGAVIWILGNISMGGATLDQQIAGFLDPFGRSLGMDGVIMLAYIIAIPANEIVVPTMLMVYMRAGQMTDITAFDQLHEILVVDNHWTLLTAVSLMLFSLLHNPCATTTRWWRRSRRSASPSTSSRATRPWNASRS